MDMCAELSRHRLIERARVDESADRPGSPEKVRQCDWTSVEVKDRDAVLQWDITTRRIHMKPSGLLIMGVTVLLALAATVLILHDIDEAGASQSGPDHEAARAWLGCSA
jgi:hypothetical protein